MPVASHTSLDQLRDPWLTQLRADDTAHQTERRYRAATRRFLAWHAEVERRPAELADFTPITLQSYRLHLQHTERLAPATINVHVAALRAWGRWLHESGAIEVNGARNLRTIGTTAPDSPRGLATSEVNALLRAAQRSRNPARDYAIVQVMLQTGIRIGECAAVQVADIDLGEKSGVLRVRAGKGNKYRVVPLNGSARSALAAYVAPIIDSAEASLRSVAQAWPTYQRRAAGTPLWQSQKGGQLSASGMWRIISGLVATGAARGLIPAEASPHDLRHTFARGYLKEHPGDLVGLAQLLGHSDINTTAIYTRATADDLATRVEELGLNAFTEEPPAQRAREPRRS